MTLTRRTALLGGGLIAASAGVLALRPRTVATEPIPGLPGFRRLQGSGDVSAGSFATIGLDRTGPTLSEAAMETATDTAARDMATALHGPDGPGIAFFTSAGCPLCPVQAERLPDAATLRPVAFFGPASERAARAMIVAPALHDRLIRTRLVIDDAYLTAILEAEGLDPAATLPQLDAPETTARLALNHALAAMLKLPGTPAIVVGRTLAIGLTSRGTLTDLMRQEGLA